MRTKRINLIAGLLAGLLFGPLALAQDELEEAEDWPPVNITVRVSSGWVIAQGRSEIGQTPVLWRKPIAPASGGVAVDHGWRRVYISVGERTFAVDKMTGEVTELGYPRREEKPPREERTDSPERKDTGSDRRPQEHEQAEQAVDEHSVEGDLEDVLSGEKKLLGLLKEYRQAGRALRRLREQARAGEEITAAEMRRAEQQVGDLQARLGAADRSLQQMRMRTKLPPLDEIPSPASRAVARRESELLDAMTDYQSTHRQFIRAIQDLVVGRQQDDAVQQIEDELNNAVRRLRSARQRLAAARNQARRAAEITD
jgi:hypothetical protein